MPLYEYEKGRTQAAKEAMAKALIGQVPVVEQDEGGADECGPAAAAAAVA